MFKKLWDARNAHRKKDVKASKKAHDENSIHRNSGEHVGDFVYGGIDGSVTTFAVVSGVAGAALSNNIVIILGLANLFADGLSMAVGNYLSSKSEREFIQQERKREEWEIKHVPEGEIQEVREIYKKKGFSGKLLDDVVKKITSNKKVWVDTMMTEELGLIEDKTSPVAKGTVTFISFVLIGFIPLLSYIGALFLPSLVGLEYSIAIVLTAIAFFFVGSAKVFITGKNWFTSGMETLVIGGIAAIVSYGIGYALRGLA